MNTLQIHECLRKDPYIKKYSPKVYALDQFMKKVKRNNKRGIFIVNDEIQTKPGNHWILIIQQADKVIFFDSFARPAESYRIKDKLYEMNRTLVMNRIQLQNPFSTVCGQYCIYFAYQISRGKKLNDILKNFSKDLLFNDGIVYNFVNHVFN